MKTNAYLDPQAERLLAINFSLSHVLLYGLEQSLAADLLRALAPQHKVVAGGSASFDLSEALRNERLDIIFCSSKPEFCRPLLSAVKQLDRHIPVVVVSAEPEFGQWLDAMEAGASDYCSAPFQREQLHFLLASHLTANQLAA